MRVISFDTSTLSSLTSLPRRFLFLSILFSFLFLKKTSDSNEMKHERRRIDIVVGFRIRIVWRV